MRHAASCVTLLLVAHLVPSHYLEENIQWRTSHRGLEKLSGPNLLYVTTGTFSQLVFGSLCFYVYVLTLRWFIGLLSSVMSLYYSYNIPAGFNFTQRWLYRGSIHKAEVRTSFKCL